MQTFGIVIVIICFILLFCTFFSIFLLETNEHFYFSAVLHYKIFLPGIWKEYKNAKKHGVKIYLRAEDVEKDRDNLPLYYLYPIEHEDGGIEYILYKKNEWITGNFQLTSRL